MKKIVIAVCLLMICGCQTTQEYELERRLNLYQSENLKAYNKINHLKQENEALRDYVNKKNQYWIDVKELERDARN